MDPTRPERNKNLGDFDLSKQDTRPSDHPPQPMQSPFPAMPQLVTKTSQRNINLGDFDQSPQDTRPFDHPQQTMQSPLPAMPQLVTRSSQTTNRRSRNLQGSSSAALHHASNADPIATPSQKFKGAQDNALAKIVAGDAADFKTTLLRSHKQFPDFASVIEKKANIDQQPSSPEISATDIGNHSEPMLTAITAQPEWSRKLSVICEENDICGLEDLLSDKSTNKQEKINAIRVELGKNQFLESEFTSELARFVRIRADPETRVSTHLTTDLCEACNSRNNEDVNAVLSDDQISPDDMRYGIWVAMREGFNDEILGSFLLYAQKHGFAKDFIELANNHGKDIDDLNPTPATNVVAISPNQYHVLQVVQNAIDWVKAKLPHAINQRQGVLDSNGEAELRGLFYQLRARGKHDVSREEIRDRAIISVEAGGGSCRSYAATLLVKLSGATDLPLTLAEV